MEIFFRKGAKARRRKEFHSLRCQVERFDDAGEGNWGLLLTPKAFANFSLGQRPRTEDRKVFQR
jgi:hypothetical protein